MVNHLIKISQPRAAAPGVRSRAQTCFYRRSEPLRPERISYRHQYLPVRLHALHVELRIRRPLPDEMEAERIFQPPAAGKELADPLPVLELPLQVFVDMILQM